MANQKKQLQVDEIINLIKNNPNFTLVGFGQTPHMSLEDLRRELRKVNSNFKVIKNALFEKAINKLAEQNKDFKEFTKFFPLRDNSALLSLNADFVSGLTSFFKKSKSESGLSFKFGYLDKTLYQNEELSKIAQLPPYEELLGKIIGSLKSPQTRFVYALKFNVNKLVYVLKAKGGEQS